MNRALMLALAVLLASCGVKRPLILPKEVPAYEAERQKRIEGYQQDQQSAAPLTPLSPAPSQEPPSTAPDGGQ